MSDDLTELALAIKHLDKRVTELERRMNPAHYHPIIPLSSICKKCLLDWAAPMGYVCHDFECPMTVRLT